MKKNLYKKYWIIAFIAVVVLASYIYIRGDLKTKESLEYDFGVVLTKAHEKDSVISYYRKNGELVLSQHIPLAWLGISYGSFGDNSTNLYTKVDSEDGTIFELDKDTGTYKVHEAGYNAMTVFADADYVYYANNSSEEATIYKYNPDTKEERKLKILGGLVTSVYAYKDNVYAACFFDEQGTEGESYIYIIDKDNFEVKRRELDQTTRSIRRVIGMSDKVYFANNMEYEQDEYRGVLTIYDIDNDVFEDHYLEYGNLYEMFAYNEEIIITHVDMHSGGRHITFFNPYSNESRVIKLDHMFKKAAINGQYFIVSDLQRIYVYRLKEFELVSSINIDNDQHYMTTIFSRQ